MKDFKKNYGCFEKNNNKIFWMWQITKIPLKFYLITVIKENLQPDLVPKASSRRKSIVYSHPIVGLSCYLDKFNKTQGYVDPMVKVEN